MAGKLQLIFMELGDYAGAFQPKRMRRMMRQSAGTWRAPEVLVDGPELPWDVKVRGSVAYMTSYAGDHYTDKSDANLQVYFKQSLDGLVWKLVDDKAHVYSGGVSEVAFEFDHDGSIWAVTRNEDGDKSGRGSHLCYAPPDDIAAWQCPDKSDPERYDSPELFRHGKDLFLVARRDIGGPFGDDPTLAEYSMRPKRTALYRLDKAAKKIIHIQDLPGAGDTAFPSVRRTGPHSFLLANYTSPLDKPDATWVAGQLNPKGTQIYLLTLDFVAQP